ncbi:MAG: PEP-CTERM sorting domain-containing protein [Planctomycetota bacterium]
MPRFEQPGRGMVARARAVFRATRLGIAFAATAWLTGIVGVPMAHGQSTTWDSMLSNSHWYVPEENLLSYMTSATSFLVPAPSPGSDQTLWSLGTATNGVFSGTAVATFRPASAPVVAITNTNTIVSGIVTDSGQIRMVFQALSSGQQTIGIGQVRTISGTDYMQMQMITGNSSVLTTHWAYMAKYDPATFTPPTLFPDGTLLSQEWRWTEGSTWLLRSDTLFGPSGTGSFTITDYRNGYFWGPGTGPDGTAAASYTQLGSITPEGNVLFNVIIGGTLTSLAGQITGTGWDAKMVLRSYDGTTFGPQALATVQFVPEPSVWAMAVAGIACAVVAARRRRRRGAGDAG